MGGAIGGVRPELGDTVVGCGEGNCVSADFAGDSIEGEVGTRVDKVPGIAPDKGFVHGLWRDCTDWGVAASGQGMARRDRYTLLGRREDGVMDGLLDWDTGIRNT
jgi:hypothetical protein